ncbi:uncharacterized protein PADG_11836 [Paracoccidioides brasiliensis Pb18]|uniref:Chromo domain-containing protein n=1 Tax=Paracoccidioides brasiliensis (strain Pb18) TaxID=502780 RepID=A0A0A0HXA4_PARBD|nr:uncharacterized protein PADG_11836 [Paracoccidioides brasiliensis Pb18]KGM92045.1 hypothetical protein PADG_11836 [Paracoccidioides brasiliensis Pb18]
MKQYAKDNPHEFNVGDQVYLNTKNLKTRRPNKKLDSKFAGPFQIRAKIGPQSYQLDLPRHFQIHDVFHISLLKPHKMSQINENRQHTRTSDEQWTTNNDNDWEIDEILDSRIIRGKLRYRVRWRHKGPEFDEWMDPIQLPNAEPFLQQYHNRYPTRPQPTDKDLGQPQEIPPATETQPGMLPPYQTTARGLRKCRQPIAGAGHVAASGDRGAGHVAASGDRGAGHVAASRGRGAGHVAASDNTI